MYTDFYRLSSTPFRLTPDPKFFFASSVHSRGLAYLRYGLQQGQGFVVITGVPGTGKSMLIQALLAELSRQQVTVATIANTNLEADDVLRAVADAFGVRVSGSSKADYITTLERFFRAQTSQGRHVLLVVDEAQNLPRKSLEELRMLSNFQEGNRLLLQTVLIGQQQLRRILADPSLEQLSQRVIATCHLKPITAEETRAYIECRLRASGWRGTPSFSGEALVLAYRATGGNPRLINILADRLLLAGYLAERSDIDLELVEGVLAEFNDEAGGVWNGRGLLDAADVPALQALPSADDVFDTPEPSVAAPTPEVVDEPLAQTAAEPATEVPSSASDEPFKFDSEFEAPVYDVADTEHLEKGRATSERQAANDRMVDEDGFYADDAPEFTQRPQPPRRRLGGAAWGSIASTLVLCAMGTYMILDTDVTTKVATVLPLASSPSQAPVNTDNEVVASSSSNSETVTLAAEAPSDLSTQDGGGSTAVLPAETAENQPLQKPPAPVLPEAVAEPVLDAVKPVPKAAPAPKPVEKAASPKPAPRPESKLEPVKPAVPKTQLAKTEARAAAEPKKVEAKPVAPKPIASTKTKPATEQAPTAVVDKAAAPGVSLLAANDLAHGFALAYEEGDLQYFPKMFRSDAQADGTRGIVNIMRDYQELFQATMMRNMVLHDFEWTLKGDTAQGVGMFEVSVWEDAQAAPSVVKGEIEFEMIRARDDQRLLIKNLSHRPH